ncbi:hypothetical protein [Nocardia brasiliensis]|uniref:hypothetical protein n=1 Tax=Nocardia brasiliensis TaxID=37326 RepID=UPI00245612B5|nr:hypothetical protein [Nocardia brasiliensis]
MIDLIIVDHVIVVRPTALRHSRFKIDPHRHFRLPTAAQRAIGVATGDVILLVALPDCGVVVAVPPTVLFDVLAPTLAQIEARP